jgi:mRNA interferase MazF
LTAAADGVPADCVASFDNLHTVPRRALRRRVATLSPHRMNEACRALNLALGCGEGATP